MPRHFNNEPKAEVLLAWYDRHARALPWRVPPGAAERADPYRVWLSEVMLQQTTVAAVARYYAGFLARWPSVEALAAAPLEDVLAEWAGLGYYARARALHACARDVAARGGAFPDTEEALRALPGIGPYTAGAIAAIAFGRRAAAIDANAERVLARLFAVEERLPAAKARLQSLAQSLVPEDRPGDFAQALMDLGATICTVKRPLCAVCPWAEVCAGRRRGVAETLPIKAPKGERATRRGAAFVLSRADGAVLLRRRPPKGLLGGMLEVPGTPWAEGRRLARIAAIRHAPADTDWRKRAGTVAHTFTHFHLELDVYCGETDDCARPSSPVHGGGGSGRSPETEGGATGEERAAPPSVALSDTSPASGGGWLWADPSRFAALALPTVMRKVLAQGLAEKK